MKVALLALTRGGLSGGYRKYLDRLVPLLREQREIERVDVFLPPRLAAPGSHTWSGNDHWFGFRGLKRQILELQSDVIFIPTATLLRAGNLPVVTMVHNMEPLEVPFEGNGMAERMKNVVRAAASRYACFRSDRVIAVSEHVRSFLVDHWGVPASKVGLIHPGVDPAPPSPLPVPQPLERVAGTRFLFTAGSIRPARGLEDVIAALSSVPEDVRLVIAGSVDRGAEHYKAAMDRLAAASGVTQRIIWAGQLDRLAISWCFRSAALFVMTSHVEACPNVVLEAMVEGARSISTDKAPMPELFAESALYYRARDSRHLAEQINMALEKPGQEWAILREAGLARAARFNWETTARETVGQFQHAIDQCASST